MPSIKKQRKRIFCFTYAGGTSAFFNQIELDLKGYELVKLEYAGHGVRHKEQVYDSFDSLADDMFEQIRDNLDNDYALFGYSMGSISAVEVLKRIIDSGLNLPTHVFLAAHEPHTKSELLGYMDDEADEWVKKRTIEFGAVPEKLQNNKVFWRTYLPLYRADYTIIGKYNFEKLGFSTTIPGTVFYSDTDTPRSEMEQWKRIFIGECELKRFEGNHFFIQQHHDEMAEIIRQRMEMKNDI
ncbi:thioesterase II family protein [Butyrivibrio proteoclasticus]|uniref:thioesterase II family protein n=1 Tax=Butyrivibrio proteoclasticus TaxID=43305 RepID=UPI00047C1A68|nr:thioesterase domain-containing protein [Butyrivibrio proteoclasticus]